MVEEINEEVQTTTNDNRSLPGDVKIPNRIFVKGFPKETQDEELKEFFEIYGIVHDANIVRTEDGSNRGFAFVTFDSQEIAEKVIEMGVIPYKDRNLVIGSAKIRERRPIHVYSYSQNPYPPEQYMVVSQDQLFSYYMKPDGSWLHVPPFSQAIPVMANATKGSYYQIEHAPYYENYYPAAPQQQTQLPISPQRTSPPLQQTTSPLPNGPTPYDSPPAAQVTSVSYCHLYPHQEPAIIQATSHQPNFNHVPSLTALTPAYPVYLNGVTDAMGNMIINDQQPNYVTFQPSPIENTCELRGSPIVPISSPIMTSQHVIQTSSSAPRVHFDNVIHYEDSNVTLKKKEIASNIMFVEPTVKPMKAVKSEHNNKAPTPFIKTQVKVV